MITFQRMDLIALFTLNSFKGKNMTEMDHHFGIWQASAFNRTSKAEVTSTKLIFDKQKNLGQLSDFNFINGRLIKVN